MVTFASGRHGLISWKRWLEMLTNHTMVFQFCRPVWDLWIRYALMVGALDGSVEDYRSVRWVAPPVEMLDAAAEVKAVVERVRTGFMSRTKPSRRPAWTPSNSKPRSPPRIDAPTRSAWCSIPIRDGRPRKAKSSRPPWTTRRRPQLSKEETMQLFN